MKRYILVLLAAVVMPCAASAQSAPNWSYGYTPSAGEVRNAFSTKQDRLTFTPLNQAGGTMAGKLQTIPSTINRAGFSVLPGIAPTAPADGDLWATSAGFFGRIGGSTIQLPSLGAILPRSLSGAPTTTGTFLGSGTSALFGVNFALTASSASTPEIGAQFGINSNVGNANVNAYKIGMTSTVVGGANSAPIYGANIITLGAGPYLNTGLEVDVGNNNPSTGDLGTTTAAYGIQSVSAGNYNPTAAYWATAATSSWKYGFAVSNHGSLTGAATAGFYDGSNSTTAILIQNSHTTVLDASAATVGVGIVLNNNIPAIFQKDGGGTLRNAIKIDGASYAQVGDAGLSGVKVMAPLIEPTSSTPASSTAPCTVGQHAWDASYEYRCVASNTWRRAALATW